jgi:hypothetical protein
MNDSRRLQVRRANVLLAAKKRSALLRQERHVLPSNRDRLKGVVIKEMQLLVLSKRKLCTDAAIVIQTAFRARFAVKMKKLLLAHTMSEDAVTCISRFWRSVRHLSKADVSRLVKEEQLDNGWSLVLNMQTVHKMTPRGYSFSGSIRFNGWKICICYKRNTAITKKTKRKREADDKKPPSRGFWHIDQIKHMNVMDYFQLIGGDPGRQEIIRLVDAGSPPLPAEKKTHKMFPTVVYRNSQRRYETLVPMHQKLEEKERTGSMEDGTREMSMFARKSSQYSVVCGYFDARREHYLSEALQHYGQMKYRQRAFQRDQGRQKSEEALIERIENLQHNPIRPIAIAWGSGSRGHPGMPGLKGRPSCPGVGLAKRMSKRFLVLVTPEHYTSKTCSLCGDSCGSCAPVDRKLRERLMRKTLQSTDDPDILERVRRSLCTRECRDLRRCNNVDCGAHLHRDYNAAVNIYHKALTILHGQDTGEGDALDIEFGEYAI